MVTFIDEWRRKFPSCMVVKRLTLTTLKYFCSNHGGQRGFSIWNHQCLNLALSVSFKYLCYGTLLSFLLCLFVRLLCFFVFFSFCWFVSFDMKISSYCQLCQECNLKPVMFWYHAVSFNPFNAGTVFIRQNLTSFHVRFWREKTIPALKELQYLWWP